MYDSDEVFEACEAYLNVIAWQAPDILLQYQEILLSTRGLKEAREMESWAEANHNPSDTKAKRWLRDQIGRLKIRLLEEARGGNINNAVRRYHEGINGLEEGYRKLTNN